MNEHAHGDHDGPNRNTLRWVFAALAAVAVFFLWTEHRAHLYGALPYLLVAACLLMHLFHRGHGGRGTHQHGGSG